MRPRTATPTNARPHLLQGADFNVTALHGTTWLSPPATHISGSATRPTLHRLALSVRSGRRPNTSATATAPRHHFAPAGRVSWVDAVAGPDSATAAAADDVASAAAAVSKSDAQKAIRYCAVYELVIHVKRVLKFESLFPWLLPMVAIVLHC